MGPKNVLSMVLVAFAYAMSDIGAISANFPAVILLILVKMQALVTRDFKLILLSRSLISWRSRTRSLIG